MGKILYILSSDPLDKRSWSGICYSCLEQLSRYYDVETIVIQPNKTDKLLRLLYKGVVSMAGKHHLSYQFSKIYSKHACRRLNSILKDKSSTEYKAIFLIGMHLGSYIKTDIPIMYYSDATFELMRNYYSHFNSCSPKTGDEIQKRTLENTKWAMFASEWAKNSAVNYYKISSSKCIIGKFGANVDTSDFCHKHDFKTRNLLFVGVDWERKGGDIAVECIRELGRLDPTNHYVLHLVGARPPYEIQDENIKIYGFLNRNIPEQKQLMISLREKADLFLLPTKAECAGIVFCESSAYGIPSITYNTGGIGSYVYDGENGFKLPIGSSGKDFANKIIEIFDDKNLIGKMQHRAVEMYNRDMNWNHLGDLIKATIG